jgi:hypothetical protein
MSREAHRVYVDPLDAVWLAVARAVGLTISRSSEVYASTDGRGRLVLGDASTLDPDDCLAQMVFHEICHALVQGYENLSAPDWGLDNETDRDFVREHACLRLQATLASRYGLREVLAPTTDFRSYYDALPEDPLSGDGDPAIRLAHEALTRVGTKPFSPWLEEGLEATRVILAAVRAIEDRVGDEGEQRTDVLPPLHAVFRPKA